MSKIQEIRLLNGLPARYSVKDEEGIEWYISSKLVVAFGSPTMGSYIFAQDVSDFHFINQYRMTYNEFDIIYTRPDAGEDWIIQEYNEALHGEEL